MDFAHDIHWYILIPGFAIMLIIGWFFYSNVVENADLSFASGRSVANKIFPVLA